KRDWSSDVCSSDLGSNHHSSVLCEVKADAHVRRDPRHAQAANAVRDALLSQDYPSPKQSLQRLQQITEDEVLRTEVTRCARSDFRCAREPLLEGLEHADVLLSIAVGRAVAEYLALYWRE